MRYVHTGGGTRGRQLSKGRHDELDNPRCRRPGRDGYGFEFDDPILEQAEDARSQTNAVARVRREILQWLSRDGNGSQWAERNDLALAEAVLIRHLAAVRGERGKAVPSRDLVLRALSLYPSEVGFDVLVQVVKSTPDEEIRRAAENKLCRYIAAPLIIDRSLEAGKVGEGDERKRTWLREYAKSCAGRWVSKAQHGGLSIREFAEKAIIAAMVEYAVRSD